MSDNIDRAAYQRRLVEIVMDLYYKDYDSYHDLPYDYGIIDELKKDKYIVDVNYHGYFIGYCLTDAGRVFCDQNFFEIRRLRLGSGELPTGEIDEENEMFLDYLGEGFGKCVLPEEESFPVLQYGGFVRLEKAFKGYNRWIMTDKGKKYYELYLNRDKHEISK